MIDELLVSATPYGVRTAAIAGGRVVALNAESALAPERLGNIYVAAEGRRGAMARFVAIGQDESAFLQKSAAEESAGGTGGGGNLLVQITRGAWRGKAARVSGQPALAGRYLVFFPTGGGGAMAQRIGDKAERARLLPLAEELAADGGGITIRSAAAGVAEQTIRAEALRHRAAWADITARRADVAAPALIARGPSLAERLLRDVLPQGARILTDDKAMHARLSVYAETWAPEFLARLELAEGALFERHDAGGALDAALMPEVALAGGGRLSIEPTQALNAIDVDSGVRAGARANALAAACTEAADAAAREIRLRNLAGLIVIDFPLPSGGTGGDAGQALAAEMRALMKDDPVAHHVTGISASGLMEITRRRAEAPILDALTEAREGDYGGGYGGLRRRLDALAFDIAQQARIEVQAGARAVTLSVAPALAAVLRQIDGGAADNDYSLLADWLGRAVTVAEAPERGREEWAIEAA